MKNALVKGRGETGILWFVDDNLEQRNRFYHSYQTACHYMPEVRKAVVYTGTATNAGCAEIHLLTRHTAHAAKFDAWSVSPFENTLFLDNDTFVLRDMQRLIETNEFVTALPYPDFYNKAYLQVPFDPTVPSTWRNVNSGVVIYSRAFIKVYRRIWEEWGEYVHLLPGYDQCLFSLSLATTTSRWRPLINLQVTTTPYAVDFIRRCRGLSPSLSLGCVPFSLILDAYVFHYTAEKEYYSNAFRNAFQIDQVSADKQSFEKVEDFDNVVPFVPFVISFDLSRPI